MSLQHQQPGAQAAHRRDLVVTQNVTLDGVVEATGGWFGPAGGDGADRSDQEAALREQREAADTLLMGRVTFEQMRGFWPHQTDDPSGTAGYLDAVAKVVVSGTLGDPGWARTDVLAGDPVDGVRTLKARAGRDIVCTGSIMLVHTLIAAGLVDELRLFVHPVVLGRGRRLFPDGSAVPRLRLVEATPFRSGVVLLRHRTA